MSKEIERNIGNLFLYDKASYQTFGRHCAARSSVTSDSRFWSRLWAGASLD